MQRYEPHHTAIRKLSPYKYRYLVGNNARAYVEPQSTEIITNFGQARWPDRRHAEKKLDSAYPRYRLRSDGSECGARNEAGARAATPTHLPGIDIIYVSSTMTALAACVLRHIPAAGGSGLKPSNGVSRYGRPQH